MRESHSNSEAKITQQKSVISYQQKEIDEYEEKIKNQDEKLKKMQALDKQSIRSKRQGKRGIKKQNQWTWKTTQTKVFNWQFRSLQFYDK